MKGKLIMVYGGQWGSEGKGEIAAKIGGLAAPIVNSKNLWHNMAVRIGGPNAGHTSYDPAGNKIVVQSLPTPSALYGWPAVLGAEAIISPEQLVKELREIIERTGKPLRALYMDRCAVLIDQAHKESERYLVGQIGSTAEGVGAATADKIWRNPAITVEHNWSLITEMLAPWVEQVMLVDTPGMLNMALVNGSNLLIEGTQGWGLSLHTSGYYPFTTSRECTPQALLAGTGINSRNASQTISVMVVRTFPIRVGGNSGILPGEIEWSDLPGVQPEITTVTKRQRRVARIDPNLLRKAVLQTGPDYLAVTFIDYALPELAGVTWPNYPTMDQLPPALQGYLAKYDALCTIGFVTTGPNCTTMLRNYPPLVGRAETPCPTLL